MEPAPDQGLRDLVQAADALGDRPPHADEPERLWRELLDGQWRHAGCLERAGIRSMVLRASSDTSHIRLSRVQVLVVTMAAGGTTTKGIAYTLHMSHSSVSTHLRRALRKLAVPSRRRLCMIHAFLFGIDKEIADGEIGPSQRDPDARTVSPRTRAVRIAELEWLERRVLVISVRQEVAPGKLTHAEHEVARLAANGKTNFEIARIRSRSPRTVANQLASSFRKLGVTSRSELAAALMSIS